MRYYFFYFEYLSKNRHFLTRTINDYRRIFEFQIPNVKSALLSLTILYFSLNRNPVKMKIVIYYKKL